MKARRMLPKLDGRALAALAAAALLWGCDVMGGGPSVSPPNAATATPSPTPVPLPSVSPTVAPSGAARKASAAGIR